MPGEFVADPVGFRKVARPSRLGTGSDESIDLDGVRTARSVLHGASQFRMSRKPFSGRLFEQAEDGAERAQLRRERRSGLAVSR